MCDPLFPCVINTIVLWLITVASKNRNFRIYLQCVCLFFSPKGNIVERKQCVPPVWTKPRTKEETKHRFQVPR